MVAVEDALTRRAPQYRTALACAVFALVVWRYGKLNLHALRHEERVWLYESPRQVQEMVTQVKAMYPKLPRGTRMMFVEDGVGWGEWTPMFIMRLLYDDRAMVVDRLKARTEKPAGWTQFTSLDKVHYDHVFTYRDGRYEEVPAEIAASQGLKLTKGSGQ